MRKPKLKYETWQQAAMAAGRLGIKSSSQYLLYHDKDPLLPGSLRYAYKNFPGYKKFRYHFWGRKGQKKKKKRPEYYTYKEAVQIVRASKINDIYEYRKLREKHPKLPPNPRNRYSNLFPGWPSFLGKRFGTKTTTKKVA